LQGDLTALLIAAFSGHANVADQLLSNDASITTIKVCIWLSTGILCDNVVAKGGLRVTFFPHVQDPLSTHMLSGLAPPLTFPIHAC
jgi:hypothetical protein